MECRNCGAAGGQFYDVVLEGDREASVVLCAACYDDYVELGWIRDATEIEG